jgi:peptidoglycan/xylan/chitin deacetylase (PgdA/CDA1 family)
LNINVHISDIPADTCKYITYYDYLNPGIFSILERWKQMVLLLVFYKMRLSVPLLLLILSSANLFGQKAQLAAIYEPLDETVSYLLFGNDGAGYKIMDAFKAREFDLAPNHPGLCVTGDFTGDGRDELAVFSDLEYNPNLNPAFTCSVVTVNRSTGTHFVPSGSWFSTPSSQLDFEYVNFSVAGDYNQDGLCDIALFYNDPAVDQLTIYLLESTGSGFKVAQPWYTVDRNEFNFTAMKFASPGDFNGNGKPDIAVFYNYFGTTPGTKQSVFLFESEGDSFSLLPVVFNGTKADYDFSLMKFALSGDYNLDHYSDIAVLLEDTANKYLNISVFKGSITGELYPVLFNTYPETELDLAHIIHATGGDFAGDTAADLSLFYDHPVSGNQEILLMESNLTSFKDPEAVLPTGLDTLSMASLSALRSGGFIHQPLVTATTWKDNRKGAVSFTFDDGYRGAFDYGGGELEAASLKGTFYIFTDTSTIYDAELAPTSLIRTYKEKGHEIGSHTANHSDLGFLTGSGQTDSMEQVLSASVDLLNERFSQQTITMSIPFGSFRYETLEYLSHYFQTARSSQYGFNLATPYDFYALKSWPILSTTSPARVDSLLLVAETFGYYLPLMYHDLVDGPFDEDLLIYTYSREHFRETVQMALERDLWIDTHERIYKYIRERNALKIIQLDTGNMDSQPGYFTFVAEDGLADSLFNVELTLKITLPDGWMGDTVTVGPEDSFSYVMVQQDNEGSFILYDWLPVSGVSMAVHEGKLTGTGFSKLNASPAKVSLTASPNPFIHESFIQVSGNTHGNGYLVVRDIHGRIVREIGELTGGYYLLPREDLSPGIYIIQLIDSGQQVAAIMVVAQ